MPDHEPPITLGLSQPAPPAPQPSVDDLQFRRAQREGEEPPPPSKTCVVCKLPIADEYFHAQGEVVCPSCTQKIQSGQQAPPHVSLLRAALYGGAAALAGMIIYAGIAIIAHLEIGLIAILVGYMVGKAIRHASGGLGGRPQQILAVALTYFSITTSYIPVFIYETVKEIKAEKSNKKPAQQPQVQEADAKITLGQALVTLLALAAAAPFLGVFQDGPSGLLTIAIIFFGLQRAWKLTGRTDILVAGPYKSSEA